MQGHSDEFATVVRKSHTAVCKATTVQDGKAAQELAVHAGSVTADRTAAQMRSFEVEIADPTGTLTPEGMTSLLAPFGTRLQLWRGARIASVETRVALHNTAGSWQVSGTSTGVMNGVAVVGGVLTLGP
jgi:hypothetical protein